MRLNVLAQHTVHAALPAFASGFEIRHNLWAVTNRNQELFSADFVLPRKAFMGTIASNCSGVSGKASGSVLAAALMRRSSATVGIATAMRLSVFDMVFNLSAVGSAQADDS